MGKVPRRGSEGHISSILTLNSGSLFQLADSSRYEGCHHARFSITRLVLSGEAMVACPALLEQEAAV